MLVDDGGREGAICTLCHCFIDYFIMQESRKYALRRTGVKRRHLTTARM
jgi:hypothetical protein